MRTLLRASAILLLAAAPGSAAGQLSLAPSLDVGSSFSFRGLTLTNRPVVQPALTLAAERGASSVALTVWGNVEPAAYDDVAHEITALDGQRGFTEYDVIVEAAHGFGRLELGAGFIAYLFAAPADGEAEPGTQELTFSAAWDAVLSPSLALYQDVGTVRGLYGEVALDYTATVARDLALRAVLGFSRGQADADDAAYYGRDGFTHVELGAALPLQAGRLSVEPRIQAVYGIDPETRIVAPDRERRFKLFAGASFGWGFGGAEE